MTPPLIGVALTIDTLARLRPWVLERQRDVEIQEFFGLRLPNGDWRDRMRRV